MQRTLAEIAENEQRLGRRLAEPRIVRVQLLRASEDYSMRRLDGTGDFGELSPVGGPGWMVEVIGTHLAPDPDGGAYGWGAHGFYLWKTRVA